MMVSVDFWHMLTVMVGSMLVCGFIGYGYGYAAGHLRGWLEAFRANANPTEPPGGGGNG